MVPEKAPEKDVKDASRPVGATEVVNASVSEARSDSVAVTVGVAVPDDPSKVRT